MLVYLKAGEKSDIATVEICGNSGGNENHYGGSGQTLPLTAESYQCNPRTGKRNECPDF